MGGEDRGAHAGHHAVALRAQRIKVFCPAFLQKSGRGPGAEPWPRAAARGTLLCSQSAGGGQRGNPRRGFPLCGRPKPPAAPTIYERQQSSDAGRGWDPAPTRGLEERGEVGGGRRKGSSRTPTPTGPCGTGRVPRDILQDHPTPGREDRGEAGRNHSSGTSGTPSPTGRVRLHTSAVIPPGRRCSRRRTE